MLAFARMLLGGGEPVLSSLAVNAMTSDQLTDAQKAHGGLGGDFFDGRSWGFCQAVLASGAFGWDGGFGSSWLVDPAQQLIVIVLTQRMFETAQAPQVHRDIQAAAYAALARARPGSTPAQPGGAPDLRLPPSNTTPERPEPGQCRAPNLCHRHGVLPLGDSG
jgi:CubicO group peptidase (beta-lactamase class C family)